MQEKKSLFLSVWINFVWRNSPFLTLAVVIEGATGKVSLFSSKFATLMSVLMNKKCIFESLKQYTIFKIVLFLVLLMSFVYLFRAALFKLIFVLHEDALLLLFKWSQ